MMSLGWAPRVMQTNSSIQKLFGFNITFMRFQPKAGSVELDSVQRKGKSPTEKAKKGTITPIL